MRRRDACLWLAATAATTSFATLPGASLAAGPGNALVPSPSGAAGAAAQQRLAERLARLELDGLDPRPYAVAEGAAPELLWRNAQQALIALLHGVVQELPGRPDLRRDPASVPLAPWMAELLASAEPAQVIERAALASPDAVPLRAALAEARARVVAGGFPPVPLGGTLEPFSVDPSRVPALRARLAVEDPVLAAAPDGGATYDRALFDAVKRWQASVGLEEDGRVGRISQAMLNRPAEARVNQLRAALDMRRAAFTPGPERRIEVNVPEYRLRVWEARSVILEMAVIVGRPDRPTPMLRPTLSAIMFNPPWGVPMRNAREDLLPKLRRDVAAVQARGFRFFQSIDGQMTEVDPNGVDWRAVNPQAFPYIIRQDAGEANALGRIKFTMPNRDDIYMHDTPDRHLFRRPDRAFSSGCIRLEKPMELLDLAMLGTTGWDRPRAMRAIESRTTSSFSLGRPIPVRLHYSTADASGGTLRLWPDIYGLDDAYARAMDARSGRLVAAR